jgi:hypothetical protein
MTLLNVAYKIFTILLNNSLSERVQLKIISWVLDPIDLLLLISTRHDIYMKSAMSIEVHNLFTDFKQAFDSINRALIPNSLKVFNVPSKLIRLINITLQHTKVILKLNGTLTKQFEVNTGVKQGNPLSTLLFSIVIVVTMSKLEIRCNICTRLR